MCALADASVSDIGKGRAGGSILGHAVLWVRLALALAPAEPSLISSVISAYTGAVEAGASALASLLSSETAAAAAPFARSLGTPNAYAVAALLVATPTTTTTTTTTIAPPPTPAALVPVSRQALPIARAWIEALSDDALAVSADAAPPNALLDAVRSDPRIVALVAAVARLAPPTLETARGEGSEGSGSGSALGGGVDPELLLPLAAALPAPALRGLCDRALQYGAPGAPRYLARRALGSRFPGALAASDILASLVLAGDLVRTRSALPAAARLALLREASGVAFDVDDLGIFPEGALIGGIQSLVTGVLVGGGARLANGSPRTPQLLMRVLLLTAQRRPTLRATVAEFARTLIRTAGEALVEAPTVIEGAVAAAVSAATATATATDSSSAAAANALLAPIWEGFVQLMKELTKGDAGAAVAIPLSFPLLVELPPLLLRALLQREGQLLIRFRAWFGVWPDRGRAGHVEGVLEALSRVG